MPTYDFKCTACGVVSEIRRSFGEDAPVPCPACGGETKQVFHPAGVHFKGSGFHNTDYKKSSASSETASAPTCPAAGGGCAGCPAAD